MFWTPAVCRNYSNDQRFSKTSWLSLCKEAREEESHLKSGNCSVYGDSVRKYSDLTEDDSLVKFFTEVLARRDELEYQIPDQIPGGGEDNTVGANSVPRAQHKPIQGQYLIGSIQL